MFHDNAVCCLGESRVRGVGIFAVLDQLSYLGLTGKFGIWTGDTSGRKVACSNFMVFDDDRDEIKLDETFCHLDSEVSVQRLHGFRQVVYRTI